MSAIHHTTARTEATRPAALLAVVDAAVMALDSKLFAADCVMACDLTPVLGLDRAAISSRPMGEQQGQEWGFIASSLRSVEKSSNGNYGTQAGYRVRSGRGELRH